jgi:hypothetical protein
MAGFFYGQSNALHNPRPAPVFSAPPGAFLPAHVISPTHLASHISTKHLFLQNKFSGTKLAALGVSGIQP